MITKNDLVNILIDEFGMAYGAELGKKRQKEFEKKI